MEWIESLSLAESVVFGLLASALCIAVIVGFLHLLCLPPRLWYCSGVIPRKVFLIPRDKILEKNNVLYEILKGMQVNTESIFFSVSKKDIGDYLDFLILKLTIPPFEKKKVEGRRSLYISSFYEGDIEDTYVIGNLENPEDWWIIKCCIKPSTFNFLVTRKNREMAELFNERFRSSN
jgi:hypothetical protein